MKHALNFGPISVLVQAGNKAWQFYANMNEIGNGVLNDPDCGKEIDHAVLAVGYGTNPDGQEYFLVINFWGTKIGWGIDGLGYAKIEAIDGPDRCRKNQYPILPEVA